VTEPLPDIPQTWRDYSIAWLKRRSRGLPPWIDWEQLEVDVLVDVWQSQARYDPTKAKFTSFLAWVVQGAITLHLRRTHPLHGAASVAGVKVALESLDAPIHDYTRTLHESVPCDQPAPDAPLIAAEAAETLWAAVDGLREPWRTTLRQRFFEGLPYSAIAEQSDTTKTTAANREMMALRHLRRTRPDLLELCRP
jgi:RNA polymerase sigma factor (sigma-70 family)